MKKRIIIMLSILMVFLLSSYSYCQEKYKIYMDLPDNGLAYEYYYDVTKEKNLLAYSFKAYDFSNSYQYFLMEKNKQNIDGMSFWFEEMLRTACNRAYELCKNFNFKHAIDDINCIVYSECINNDYSSLENFTVKIRIGKEKLYAIKSIPEYSKELFYLDVVEVDGDSTGYIIPFNNSLSTFDDYLKMKKGKK